MPEFLTIILLSFTHYLSGFIGYFIKNNHKIIEKEVVIIEKIVEEKVENILGNGEMVKTIESCAESVLENTVKNIVSASGVDSNEIDFSKKTEN